MGGGGELVLKTLLKSKRRVNKQFCGVIRSSGAVGEQSGSRERATGALVRAKPWDGLGGGGSGSR